MKTIMLFTLIIQKNCTASFSPAKSTMYSPATITASFKRQGWAFAARSASSKQSLWDMPLFIGVSKTAHYRKSLFSTLSKMLQNPKYKEDLQKHLIETIQNVERKNIGVVPPAFIKK